MDDDQETIPFLSFVQRFIILVIPFGLFFLCHIYIPKRQRQPDSLGDRLNLVDFGWLIMSPLPPPTGAAFNPTRKLEEIGLPVQRQRVLGNPWGIVSSGCSFLADR